jgi:ERCC4-type nuclease
MMLIIDSREKEGSKLVKLVENKAKALSIQTEKKWLEIGDYVFDDVCFEAKSTTDFLGSVISKRLWTQIDNMDRHYKTNVVIIYGTIEDAIFNVKKYSKSNIQEPARSIMLNNKFLGAIGRITLDTDVKAFWVPTEEEASLIITAICKMKPIQRDVIRPEVFKRVTTDDLRLDVLTSIKGVSIKKAKLLIKEYGSVMEIGEQTEEELQFLEGVGQVLASRILNTLNSEKKVKI